MYTQCPECATAFRVTAEILRQAAGKVRCGGCGSAFNALLYLSETRPEKPARPSDEDFALPELSPEDDLDAGRGDAPPPRAMSPDQSEALLETLDELSGENIRLEDTGVEWRLLPGEDDQATGTGTTLAAGTGATVDADVGDDNGEARVDELLEESPTPIDEYLTASPHELDAPEVFESGVDTPAGSVDASEVFDNAAGEMRFDDNTGLPDDFDLEADDLPGSPAEPLRPEPQPESPAPDTPPDGLKVDIAFGAPEEWQELLNEVDDQPPTDEADQRAKEDAGGASTADAGFAKGLAVAGADDQQPLDLDTQFGMQAEALGIGSPANDGEDVEAASDEPPSFESGVVEADSDDGEIIEENLAESESGSIAAGLEENLYTADLTFEVDETGLAFPNADDDASSELLRAQDALNEADRESDGEDEESESPDESLEALLEPDFDDIEGDDEDMPSAIHDLELELGGGHSTDDDGFDLVAGDDDREPPTILPMSEEEQTINQMIDEDMLRLAVEEDDGLSSSMVLKTEDVESALAEGAEEAAADDELHEDEDAGVGVETIIMEGDLVRTALEEEALKEQAREEGHETAEQGAPENRLLTALKNTMHGRAQDGDAPAATRRRHGLVAGIGVLTVLLVAQLVHQSRAELATIPTLNGIIGPIYRTLGAPITPDWDVSGWRFEVTRGSTNAAALADELAENGRGIDFGAANVGDPEVLTIYSRIGNQGDNALPYPLVSVSLTDRFDEIIGSKVLSPNEYLTGDFDPRRFVPSGDTFDAIITIDSPDAAATGFKLNVCYREAAGKLRCAIEDFL